MTNSRLPNSKLPRFEVIKRSFILIASAAVIYVAQTQAADVATVGGPVAKPYVKPVTTPVPAKPVPFDFRLDEKPFIAAKYIVIIESYDPKTKTYHLKRPQFPYADGLYTTPESLAHSIDSLDLNVLKKRPKSIVENEYMTDRDLFIMPMPQALRLHADQPKATPHSRR